MRAIHGGADFFAVDHHSKLSNALNGVYHSRLSNDLNGVVSSKSGLHLTG
jgi:hypothetical protein